MRMGNSEYSAKPDADLAALEGPDDENQRHRPGSSREPKTANDPLASSEIMFLVSDDEGAPIDLASVEVYRNGLLEDNTKTSSSGLAALPTRALRNGIAVITAQGFSRETVRLPSNPSQIYEVNLARAGSIAGKIVMVDGAPVPSVIKIFCWKEGTEAGVHGNIPDYKAISNRFPASIDLDGTFEISGLSTDSLYGITCYGPGICITSQNEVRQVTPNSGAIRIEAEYLYVASFAYPTADQDNSLIRAAKELSVWKSQSGESGIARSYSLTGGEGLENLSPRNWSARLLGFESSVYDNGLTPSRILYSARSRDINNAQAHWNLCFGEYCTTRLDAVATVTFAASASSKSENSWSVTGYAPQLGSVLVTMVDGKSTSHTNPGQLIARLSVVSSDIFNVGKKLNYQTKTLNGLSTLSIEGIPVGIYKLQIVDPIIAVPFPAGGILINIDSAETVECAIPVPASGAVSINIGDGTIDGYNGFLVFDIGKVEDCRGGRYVSMTHLSAMLDRPPYVLSGIPPGDYYLLASGFVDPYGAPSKPSFSISAGEVTEVFVTRGN